MHEESFRNCRRYFSCKCSFQFIILYIDSYFCNTGQSQLGFKRAYYIILRVHELLLDITIVSFLCFRSSCVSKQAFSKDIRQ